MILDSDIIKIIDKIKKQYKTEFNEDISSEKVLTIINSQFNCIPDAMKNGHTVKLDKLGKFLIKKDSVETTQK